MAAPLPGSTADAASEFGRLVTELSGHFALDLEGYETEEACLTGLTEAQVGLVHIALVESDENDLPDFDAWLQAIMPGGTLVLTSTAADGSSNYLKAKEQLSERFPSVAIPLGLATEAVVAQKPLGGETPTVDLLRNAPVAVGTFLALFGGQSDLHHLPGDETPLAVGALIGRLMEQQRSERELFQHALRTYSEQATRLTAEVSEARVELAHQIESARSEREHLVREFLDRVDQLSAKISTSAARFEAELVEKDLLFEAQERRVEAYAGQAAIAQSVIDDIRSSKSWRITAPVRLMSRLFARPESSSLLRPDR